MLEANLDKYEKRMIEKGKIEEKVNIAKMMIENGETIQTIVKYTGLSKEEIEKLV